MGAGAQALAALVSDELSAPVPEAVDPMVQEIRHRCGDAPVAAVIFYGSCLRKQTEDGVLDFYVLVDAYRPASASRWLAWANSLLPPNVFYLELDTPVGRLRAKYAVISVSDFERGVGTRSLRTHLWARFCQPALAVYVRDGKAREVLVSAAARSVLTLLERILPLLSASRGGRRLDFDELWQRAFRETYRAEMRGESAEVIRALYDSTPARYDRVARLGIEELAHRGHLHCRSAASGLEVSLDLGRRRRGRLTWPLRRRLSKLIGFAGQFKTAFTFGDWLPYVLWKLERHGGKRIELTERQRQHPLVWGWPVLWRLLRERGLR